MNAIHIRDPRKDKVRAAIQSLAGRNHYPVQDDRFGGRIDKKFRGLIDEQSFLDLIEGESIMDIWCYLQSDGTKLYELVSTGLLLRKTEFVRGLFIFTGPRDLTDLDFRP